MASIEEQVTLDSRFQKATGYKPFNVWFYSLPPSDRAQVIQYIQDDEIEHIVMFAEYKAGMLSEMPVVRTITTQFSSDDNSLLKSLEDKLKGFKAAPSKITSSNKKLNWLLHGQVHLLPSKKKSKETSIEHP